ncbi:MAG: prolipoprotein diacylglyceryl transferase [Sphingobacteriales bacterium]|nr:MAG: prolipoprotein diacylglyceryl transferase [Sphingobacteriales bacterium]
MYPTLSDLIKGITGWYIPLPIQTYGFFLALGFVAGAFILYKEFDRMERAGLLHGVKEKQIVGKPASVLEILGNALIGLIIGYKVVAMILNWSAFTDNPQSFIVSSEGNWVGGIAFAILFGFLHYYSKQKEKLPAPQEIEVTVFPRDRVGELIMLAAITGILGSKLFTWIEDWDAFMADPVGALLSFSGLTFYGGLICATIALLIYSYKKKIPISRITDAAAPALIIGYGMGRLGCHFSGDGDWGIVNNAAKPFAWLPDWMWAYTYPNNVINEGIDIVGCVGKHCKVLPEPVYPTSVYEFIMAITIFLILMAFRKNIKVPFGLFALYLILNGIERFFIESIRVNQRYDVLGWQLSQAQIIAIFLVLAGIGLAIFTTRFYSKQQTTKLSN